MSKRERDDGDEAVVGADGERAVPAAALPRTEVAEHYNRRAATSTLAARRESPIVHLRNLNNWIKSVLLSQFLTRDCSVFDMCCGRGGDLPKFNAGRVGYVFGADIADGSVEEARRRNRERFHLHADFAAVDVFAVDLLATGVFQRNVRFDVTSCQFAIHYAFASEATARTMMRNATALLAPGGIFLGTMPNAAYLMARLRASADLSFGNSVYKVTFDRKPETPARYGERYVFHLEDAIDDLPEYLADFATLAALAAEHGMEPVLHKSFHAFFYDHCAQDEYYPLLERMGVLDKAHAAFNDDEWEAAGIYDVFAFRRSG